MPAEAQPTLRTARLVLRPFQDDDIPRLADLAGARRIADTTISFPHPYSVDQARRDVARFGEEWRAGHAAHFALAFPYAPADFAGYFAIRDIDPVHSTAEISFWIDEQMSGQGYVREAGREILRYAFEVLRLNRLSAFHMVRNPGSARVLTGLGFRQEGILRQRVRKWGVFEDVVASAILRQEWK